MRESKFFVLLVGESTKYLYKFLVWEIDQAIKREIPIIVVNLNGKQSMDIERCPSILKDHLALHISFNAKILQRAMEEWGHKYFEFKKKREEGPRYYKNDVYKTLGI